MFYKYYVMQLTNVSPEQLEAIRKNFEANEIVISNGEENGKYDVSIDLSNELQAWKLFFAGGSFVMDKFSKRVNEIV
jgi:hypothetical protein